MDALLEVERAAVMLSRYPCEETERLDRRSVSLRVDRNAQARAGGAPPAVPKAVWLGRRVPLEARLWEVVT